MVKRLLRIVAVITASVIVALAYVQTSWTEATLPLGTQASANLSFPHVSANSAASVRSRADRLATQTGTSVYLLKTGTKDPLNRLDVYWLGTKPSSAGQSVPWLKFGRYGNVRHATDLGSTLSGSYAFGTMEGCRRFTAASHQHLGVAISTPCAAADQPHWNLRITDVPGNLVVIGAFVLLACAIVWAWNALRSQSQRIRLLSGMPAGRIGLQDTGDLLLVYLPWLAGTWLILALATCLTHRFSASAVLVLTSSGGTLVGMTLLLVFVAFFSSLLLHPRVAQISRRQSNMRLARYGSDIFKVTCLILALVAVPEAYGTAASAATQYASASRWARLPSAVVLTTSQKFVADPLDTTGPRKLTEVFYRASQRGEAAISTSMADSLIEPEGNAKPSRKNLGPYDDIILTDSTFFRLMGINKASLKPVKASSLAPIVQKNLKLYSPMWLRGKKDSLADHLYAWMGAEPLTCLNSVNGDTGKIVSRSHPLVIYMDDPTELKVDSSAIANGDVFFTNPRDLAQIIEEVEAGPYIESMPRIADRTLFQAQQESDLAISGVCAIVACLLAIVFCAYQSAGTWAREKRRRIFLLTTSGQPTGRILAGRLAWSTCIAVVLGAVVPILAKQMVPNLELSVLYAIILTLVAVDLVVEIGFDFSRTKAAFVSVVRREE